MSDEPQFEKLFAEILSTVEKSKDRGSRAIVEALRVVTSQLDDLNHAASAITDLLEKIDS